MNKVVLYVSIIQSATSSSSSKVNEMQIYAVETMKNKKHFVPLYFSKSTIQSVQLEQTQDFRFLFA